MIHKGEIFCHVIKVKQFNQDKPGIIEINQLWKGAAPSFKRSEVIIKKIG